MKKHIEEWIEKEIIRWGNVETVKRIKNGFIQKNAEVLWEEEIYQQVIPILINCQEMKCYSVSWDKKEKRYYIDFFWKNKEYRFHFGYRPKEKEVDWNFFLLDRNEEEEEIEEMLEEIIPLKEKIREVIFIFINMPKFRVRYAIKPIEIP